MKKTGAKSKATTVNPKDLVGAQKVPLTAFPGVASLWASLALVDGREKYGPYNWRDKPITATAYIDAAYRHMGAWFDGERCASDSGVHHLGHVIATVAIVLDAEANGTLIDDRPLMEGKPSAFAELLQELNAHIKARKDAAACLEKRNSSLAKKRR